jgi:hypothetical protein
VIDITDIDFSTAEACFQAQQAQQSTEVRPVLTSVSNERSV